MTGQESAFVRVRELLGEELARLEFTALCGDENLDFLITNARVQKPGLAFAGYYEYIRAGRVQIIGESETKFLGTLSPKTRLTRFRAITAMEIPVFIIPKGLEPFPEFLELCVERQCDVPARCFEGIAAVADEQSTAGIALDRDAPGHPTALYRFAARIYLRRPLLRVADAQITEDEDPELIDLAVVVAALGPAPELEGSVGGDGVPSGVRHEDVRHCGNGLRTSERSSPYDGA